MVWLVKTAVYRANGCLVLYSLVFYLLPRMQGKPTISGGGSVIVGLLKIYGALIKPKMHQFKPYKSCVILVQ